MRETNKRMIRVVGVLEIMSSDLHGIAHIVVEAIMVGGEFEQDPVHDKLHSTRYTA